MKGEQPLCNVHLQADAAHQITNGFEQVFGSDFKRAMCWFHVTEKIKPRLQLLKDDQLRDQIDSRIFQKRMVSAATELVRELSRYIGAEHKQRTRIPQRLHKATKSTSYPDVSSSETLTSSRSQFQTHCNWKH